MESEKLKKDITKSYLIAFVMVLNKKTASGFCVEAASSGLIEFY